MKASRGEVGEEWGEGKSQTLVGNLHTTMNVLIKFCAHCGRVVLLHREALFVSRSNAVITDRRRPYIEVLVQKA